MSNTIPQSTLTKNQKKVLGWKAYTEDGTQYRIMATIRHDDECGNGHNTFSITGNTQRKDGRGVWREDSGDCVHEAIAKHFPEIAPFIKWHLMGTEHPLHYIANTVYHASNRDCWGTLKGEPRRFEKQVYWDNVPIAHKYPKKLIAFLETTQKPLEIVGYPHPTDTKTFGYNYTFRGMTEEWHKCPFHNAAEAEEVKKAFETCKMTVVSKPTAWGEGKERDFDAARSCAIWPEATDEELSLPPEALKAKLEARLPALMQAFKNDVESLGFVY